MFVLHFIFRKLNVLLKLIPGDRAASSINQCDANQSQGYAGKLRPTQRFAKEHRSHGEAENRNQKAEGVGQDQTKRGDQITSRGCSKAKAAMASGTPPISIFMPMAMMASTLPAMRLFNTLETVIPRAASRIYAMSII